MLLLISPAKTLDFTTPAPTTKHSLPEFLDEAQCLVEQLRTLSPAELARLMSISDSLAALNVQRYHDWSLPFNRDNAKQAALVFNGDVYTGLQADTFTAQDWEFAQQRLRILSGLYGVLRPLDLIQPYRLEMGTKLANQRGTNLYAFWGDKISLAINHQLQKLRTDVLVNLASNEYYKVLQPKKINAQLIHPVFKDRKGDSYKVISFYAKKARGAMGAYIIRNKLTDVLDIKKFATDGYTYNAALSTADQWVFSRG